MPIKSPSSRLAVSYADRLSALRAEMQSVIAKLLPGRADEDGVFEFDPFIATHDDFTKPVNVRSLQLDGQEIQVSAEDADEFGDGNALDDLSLDRLGVEALPTLIGRLEQK